MKKIKIISALAASIIFIYLARDKLSPIKPNTIQPESAGSTERVSNPLPRIDYSTTGNIDPQLTEISLKREDFLKSLQDPNLLLSAHCVPIRDKKGSINGFRFLEVKENSIFHAVDLRAKDGVLEINGKPLRSISDVHNFYLEFRSLKEFSFLRERGGQLSVVRVQIHP